MLTEVHFYLTIKGSLVWLEPENCCKMQFVIQSPGTNGPAPITSMFTHSRHARGKNPNTKNNKIFKNSMDVTTRVKSDRIRAHSEDISENKNVNRGIVFKLYNILTWHHLMYSNLRIFNFFLRNFNIQVLFLSTISDNLSFRIWWRNTEI